MIKNVGIRIDVGQLCFLQICRAESKLAAQVVSDFMRSRIEQEAVPTRKANSERRLKSDGAA